MPYTKIKVRRGLENDWAIADPSPVLDEGEIGFEIDTNKFKIGNGQTAWTTLPYAAVDPSNLNNTLTNYILAADLGHPQGPAQLDVDGNLIIPKSSIIFEGSTNNNVQTTLVVIDPTANRIISLPNSSGTVALTSDIPSSTTNISEGTNYYFTNERAQDAIGENIGTGLSYNDSTGAISVDTTVIQTRVSGVSDIELGYLDGVTSSIQTQINSKAPTSSPTFTGTVSGITKSMVGLGNVDNTSDANKPVSTATQTALDLKSNLAAPSFTGNTKVENIEISGALTFTGTATQIDTTNLAVSDSLIYLADSQFSSDLLDIGIYGAYGSPSNNEQDHPHTGLIRDASDGKWKLISNGSEPSNNVINFTGATYDTLKLGSLEASYVRLSGDPTNSLDAATKDYVDLIDYIRSTDSSYTISSTNLYSTTEINNSSTVTITIPNDASDTDFPIGSSMEFRQMGAGRLSFAVTSPATLVSADGYTKTRTQYSSAILEKRASNAWILTGDIDA